MDYQQQDKESLAILFHDIMLNPESPTKMQYSSTSLNSPVDSGVQLLDSESEQTSVMSSSGCELDMDVRPLSDQVLVLPKFEDKMSNKLMTKSDIANQNISEQSTAQEEITRSHCSMMDSSLKEDIMNISLNSYELLDYTMANSNRVDLDDQMHVSLSEEVNEHIAWKEPPLPDGQPEDAEIQMENPIVKTEIVNQSNALPENIVEDKPIETIMEEQIVFRRQRKKKSRNDTPKKRVSFHEDILNSTKIDDIRINHGFITIEPEYSSNFLLRGFKNKHDIVQGRYSWAAEGYYNDSEPVCNREIQSDIFVPRHCSLSSSSSASLSGSSIDEEPESKPTGKQCKEPKGSCLKKTKHRPIIDTNIVDEAKLNRKRSETNLLDGNIFGSLKNILTFSTSLPLTERGVPEGQKDNLIYSSSEVSKGIDSSSLKPKAPDMHVDSAKNNLKLRIQPMYPNNLPENVILCDSNVYEHKGISYSYEYENFSKDFEENHKKAKSSSIYQRILKEFNFFRKRAAREQDGFKENEDYTIIRDSFDDQTRKAAATSTATTPGAVECSVSDDCDSVSAKESVTTDSGTINKYIRNVNMDWSDTDSFDSNTRHLNSPRRKGNRRSNHYTSPPPLKVEKYTDASSVGSKNSGGNDGVMASSSKHSLINRFLRQVTSSKMMDMKSQRKLSHKRRQYLGMGLPPPRYVPSRIIENRSIDQLIAEEVLKGMREMRDNAMEAMNEQYKDMLDDLHDYVVVATFPISSVYTTYGMQKALLLVITASTLFVYNRSKTGRPLIAIPYQLLNSIIIGASMRTIYISTYNNNEQFMFATGSRNTTNDVMVKLEMTIRQCKERITLPAVKQLHMSEMKYLRKILSLQTPVEENDEYFYYTILNAQECQTENTDLHFGPKKEGPLMFKLSNLETRWETAYFILKAGILYMLASPSNQEPMKVFPLLNGACQGAKRVQNCGRPHTFQLILTGSVLYLAAPDEYVASDWLQCLIRAATGIHRNHNRQLALASSLLMTRQQILLAREAFSCNSLKGDSEHFSSKGPQVLSYASINDLTAFKLPSDEQSWCILEFACREVHETSGDWILYFATNSELEDFISTFEKLWIYNNEGESFPVTTLTENDLVNIKCTEVNGILRKAWI